MHKKMPKRPKQHQVEDLSITAFKNLLPREWVFREKEKDYGIDGEVEIFTPSGEATGLIFYVQLKATDSSNIQVQQKIQLKITSINYFRELEVPVLIVRYLEYTKNTYIKWSYELDLFGVKENAKTFLVKMTEDNLWTEDTASIVYENIKNARNIKNSSNLFPLKVKLDFSFDSLLGSSPYEMKSYIRDFIEQGDNKHIVNIVNREKDSICIIDVNNDKLLTKIVGFSGTVLDDYLQLEYQSIDDFISTIFVTISMCLFRIGKDSNAKQILEELAMKKNKVPLILQHPRISFTIIENYLNTHDEDKAFKLWKNISEYSPDDEEEYRYLLLGLYQKYKNFTIQILKEKILKYKELKDFKSAGVYSYNLANKLHNDSEHREAVKYYHHAIELFPAYGKTDYIFKELAGSLFELRRYKLSTKFYKYGLELSYDMKTTILYADALMYTGDYLHSLENMIKYSNDEKNIDDEWILKIFILEFIVNDLEIKKQSRDYIKAMQYSDSDNEENISESTLIQAIELDALSPLAWYNLAQLYFKNQEYEKSFLGFLITSLINGYDPEAWYNTFVSLVYSKQNLELLESIIRTGYRKTGEEFIRSIHTIGNKISIQGFDDFLDNIIEEENQETKPTIRIYNGTKFEEIT